MRTWKKLHGNCFCKPRIRRLLRLPGYSRGPTGWRRNAGGNAITRTVHICKRHCPNAPAAATPRKPPPSSCCWRSVVSIPVPSRLWTNRVSAPRWSFSSRLMRGLDSTVCVYPLKQPDSPLDLSVERMSPSESRVWLDRIQSLRPHMRTDQQWPRNNPCPAWFGCASICNTATPWRSGCISSSLTSLSSSHWLIGSANSLRARATATGNA